MLAIEQYTRRLLQDFHPIVAANRPPVDLSPWQGKELTAEVLREATAAVMSAITANLEVLRGAAAPPAVHDPGLARSGDSGPA